MADDVDVLLVEDDEDVRCSFAEILNEAGYSTAEATDTSTALELLASTNVATVVLDIYLPGRNGLWLLDQLEDLPPVVLVTAHNYDPDVMARRAKVLLYLQKPVQPPDLLQAVARSLAAGMGFG
jgi:CheY-like chemotaxis protein